MTEQQKEFVKIKVLQFIEGNISETNKLDFKREWYKLKDKTERGYWEFLKDTCAIINSYGGEEGYIVIGVDEVTKELVDAKIEDSGRNQNEIKDLIISNIADRFVIDIDNIEVNGKNLSVIWIPPSTNKPHVILKYQPPNKQLFENEIFIRNGSGSNVANKGDIDRMYWERGNILLNEQLKVTIDLRSVEFDIHSSTSSFRSVISFACYFDNWGLRPITIFDFQVVASIPKINNHVLAQRMNYKQLFFDLKFGNKANYLRVLPNTLTDYTFRMVGRDFQIDHDIMQEQYNRIEEFKTELKNLGSTAIAFSEVSIYSAKGKMDFELNYVNSIQ